MHNQAGKQAPTYAGRLADTAVNSALQCAKRIMHGEPDLLLLFMGELTSSRAIFPAAFMLASSLSCFSLLLHLRSLVRVVARLRGFGPGIVKLRHHERANESSDQSGHYPFPVFRSERLHAIQDLSAIFKVFSSC
jgi:hypothetical protein